MQFSRVQGLETAAEALEELRRVVAETGQDFFYAKVMSDPDIEIVNDSHGSCLYVHNVDGTLVPGCIVGRVLINKGLPIEELREWDVSGWRDGYLGSSIGQLGQALDLPQPVINVLGTAQTCQDNGNSYGEALAAAEDSVS